MKRAGFFNLLPGLGFAIITSNTFPNEEKVDNENHEYALNGCH